MLNFLVDHLGAIVIAIVVIVLLSIGVRKLYVYHRDEERALNYGHYVQRRYQMISLAHEGHDSMFRRHYRAIVLDVEKAPYLFEEDGPQVTCVRQNNKEFSILEIGWRYLFNRSQFTVNEWLLARAGIIQNPILPLADRIAETRQLFQTFETVAQQKAARLKDAAERVAAANQRSGVQGQTTIVTVSTPQLDQSPGNVHLYRIRVRD